MQYTNQTFLNVFDTNKNPRLRRKPIDIYKYLDIEHLNI